MQSKVIISVSEKSIEVERAKLRLWFELEDARSKLKEAAESGDTEAVSLILCSYLSVASCENIELFQESNWEEVAVAFAEINFLNTPQLHLPLFDYQDKKETDTASWEYEGRTWYLWVHTLAKAYGWTEEYISSLEIETGLALIQEAIVDDQLNKEWEWSLTEIAYEYDKGSKTSKFRALPRPNWMGGGKKPPKKTTMLKVMLPVGYIENVSGVGLHGTDLDVVH